MSSTSPINERKPLLSRTPSSTEANESPEPDPLPEQSGLQERTTRTPLPVRQLVVLCIMRITEPISYTLIFPFINQMLEDMKVSEDPKQIGYYAGLIESLFAIAQLFTAIFWGRLSDRIGRKPVMLTGLLGMAVSNVGVLQSIVGEITDATNFADAAAYLPLCYRQHRRTNNWRILIFTGSTIPNLFGDSAFLIEYPYFLPCLAGGLLNFAAIIVGVFFMEEVSHFIPTLNHRERNIDYVHHVYHSHGRDDIARDPEYSEPPSIRSLCTQPLLMVLLSLGVMHFQNTAFLAIVPLYSYTKIENGGLGLGLDDIGFMLSTSGFGMIIVQLWVFPALQRRLGALRVFQLTLGLFTITNMCPTLVTYLARLPGNTSSSTVAYMSAVLILRSPTTMCYVCTLMMTKMLAPNTLALGTLNGMTQTVRAFAQAVAPIVGTSYTPSVFQWICSGVTLFGSSWSW
ncbi:hypothetical protein PSTT_12935 [Puccinia striiformis]|uniref:Major facilitator superfamily (MFS) profile domain-containing protein n=1 Tax=Puccinia striiformis TaxID=27350 RepID=A0A2S4UTY6_9BASI|nr:hypothetical protein PSTT_12935 [Puccinia striiformis]